MKNTLNDEKLAAAFTDDDKKVIEDLSKDGLQFIESAGESSTAEELDAKQKELEAKYNPIMMRVYQASGGAPGGMPGGMGGMPGGMPGGMGGAAGGATAGVDDLD
jgi:heat shock protein 1/8